MNKIKIGGIVLMVSVILFGASVNMAKAEGNVDTYASNEDSGAGTTSNADNALTSLNLDSTDQSGIGWSYVGSTHTLTISDDVTVEGNQAEIIKSTTDLTINVAENATLTVKNNWASGHSYGIRATGNITLNGPGNIDIIVQEKNSYSRFGIYAGSGVTISNIQLSVRCATDAEIDYAILANGGSLVIEEAVVTVQGACQAKQYTGGSTRYPVKILGNSIVNIDSSKTKAIGLNGSDFQLSDYAHVKICSNLASIGDKDGNLTLTKEPASGFYWHTKNEQNKDSGWQTTSCSNSSKGYVSVRYFEYIGASHCKGDFEQDGDGTSHSKTCACTNNPTTITIACSGGEATCTKRAVCAVCHKEYGEQATNHQFVDHVCEKCGEVEDGVAATVTVGSNTRGYMKNDGQDAITYAIDHPGAVVKLLSGLSADSITINDSKANFTVDLNGQRISNGWTVTNGTVTITDSSKNSSGEIYSVTVNDNAMVSLKSGTVFHNVDVKGGVFNVDGGTIATIYFEGGRINWNSTAATVTGELRYNEKNDNIMVMNAKPGKPLNIVLDDRRDLEKPFAKVENGSILSKDISTIQLVADARLKYNLQPELVNNQLFARFPLNQSEVDITLDTTSDLVYNGSARKPIVTVKRSIARQSDDKYVWSGVDTPLTEGTDYTVSYTDNTNAGTSKVTIKGIGCYTGSVERTFTIAKAAPEKSNIAVDMSDRIYSCHKDNADRVDLASCLPKDCGTITTVVTTSGAVAYRVPPMVTDGILSYTIEQSDTAQKGTISISVTTTNYENFTVTVPIETKDLGIVCIKDGSSVALVNDTLTEGEKLSKLTFRDVTFVDEYGKEVAGTLSWQTPDTVPTLGTTSAQWVFQPNDTESYAPLSGSVAIQVQKKSTSGSGSSSGGSSSGGSSGGGSTIADSRTDDTKKDDSSKSDTKQDETKPDDTKKDDTKADDKTDDPKNDDKKQDAKTPASKGTRLKTTSGVSYQVTSGSTKVPTVAFRAAQKKAKETVTIPKTVTIDGVKYKVTSIAARAFAGNKNVKKIVVPSTITSIGRNAFADCAKLTTITINTTKLNSKNVAEGAFDNIKDKTVIQVPKSMLAKYKKLFAKKGLSKKVKIVAIKSKKK